MVFMLHFLGQLATPSLACKETAEGTTHALESEPSRTRNLIVVRPEFNHSVTRDMLVFC